MAPARGLSRFRPQGDSGLPDPLPAACRYPSPASREGAYHPASPACSQQARHQATVANPGTLGRPTPVRVLPIPSLCLGSPGGCAIGEGGRSVSMGGPPLPLLPPGGAALGLFLSRPQTPLGCSCSASAPSRLPPTYSIASLHSPAASKVGTGGGKGGEGAGVGRSKEGKKTEDQSVRA